MIGEFADDEGTRYRFGPEDLLESIEGDDVAGRYRWRRPDELALEDGVKVELYGRTYEYLEFENVVTSVSGDTPFGISEGSPLIWYVDGKRHKDVGIVKTAGGSIVGGFVPESVIPREGAFRWPWQRS